MKIPEPQEGAKMIQALQKIAGIDESYEEALAGWIGMNEYEKESTIMAHKWCCGKK